MSGLTKMLGSGETKTIFHFSFTIFHFSTVLHETPRRKRHRDAKKMEVVMIERNPFFAS